MGAREMLQNMLAALGQAQSHLAPVFRPFRPFDQAALFEPVGQADGAMMPNEKVFGHLTDGRAGRIVGCANDEQHLVLLRLQFF